MADERIAEFKDITIEATKNWKAKRKKTKKKEREHKFQEQWKNCKRGKQHKYNGNTKADIQMANKCKKKMLRIICQQGISNRNNNETTAHPLEWPKFITLTTPDAGDDVEQRECSYIAGGNANGTATLEENLTVF